MLKMSTVSPEPDGQKRFLPTEPILFWKVQQEVAGQLSACAVPFADS